MKSMVALGMGGLILGGVAIPAVTMRNLIDDSRWNFSQSGEVGAELTKFAVDPSMAQSSWFSRQPVGYRVSVSFTNHRSQDVILQNALQGAPIQAGEKYSLRFFARSNTNAPTTVTFRGWKQSFQCAGDWKEFSLPMKPQKASGPLTFQMGEQRGAIDLANIRLTHD